MNEENVDTFVTRQGTDVKSGGGKKRPAKEGRAGEGSRGESVITHRPPLQASMFCNGANSASVCDACSTFHLSIRIIEYAVRTVRHSPSLQFLRVDVDPTPKPITKSKSFGYVEHIVCSIFERNFKMKKSSIQEQRVHCTFSVLAPAAFSPWISPGAFCSLHFRACVNSSFSFGGGGREKKRPVTL